MHLIASDIIPAFPKKPDWAKIDREVGVGELRIAGGASGYPSDNLEVIFSEENLGSRRKADEAGAAW